MKQLLFTIFLLTTLTFAQSAPDYGSGLKFNLNEEGSKYLRVISWGQVQAQFSDNVPETSSKLNFNLRRARIIIYSQISSDFLILTHFGLNSLNADNLTPTGKGESSQLFLHDFWVQHNLNKNHAIGAGLHYWNGISRLNNSSTLNFLTLDNQRQAWATLGLSDQFVRHIGFYLKGVFDKFQYRISVNESITNNLQALVVPVNNGPAIYTGRRLLGSKKAGKNFAGYVEYALKDAESNFLPYKVGTYLGTKKILNIGAGFFTHPNGAVIADNTGNLSGETVTIVAADIFYDVPLGENGAALTAYGLFQNNNYGKNFTLGTTYETGTLLHGHIGYVLPSEKKTKIQPYFSFDARKIEALNDNANQLGFGSNFYFNGNNSKLTLEYQNLKYATQKAASSITLQAMIYL